MQKDTILIGVVQMIGGCFLLAGIATAALWYLHYERAALVIGAISILLWHLMLISGTVILTARFTRSMMETGAQVALQAQSVDGQWDSVQATSYTQFAKALMGVVGSQQRQVIDERPGLPNWGGNGKLPPLD